MLYSKCCVSKMLDKPNLMKLSKGEINAQQRNTGHPPCRDSHLEGDLSGHGEPMSDVGLLVLWSALPAVQLNATAAGKKHLPVHLH